MGRAEFQITRAAYNDMVACWMQDIRATVLCESGPRSSASLIAVATKWSGASPAIGTFMRASAPSKGREARERRGDEWMSKKGRPARTQGQP